MRAGVVHSQDVDSVDAADALADEGEPLEDRDACRIPLGEPDRQALEEEVGRPRHGRRPRR